jgi:glycosyltransferase involved in cell wall biosynthesis
MAHAWLIRRAVRVVAVAESVRREIIETFGVPPDRVVTIPRGIDASVFAPTTGREQTRRSLGIGRAAPVVLSLGALSWEKDPLVHVELGARILADFPEAIHLVVGDGPLRLHVREAIRRRGLDGRIRLLGVREDVADLVDASDVLLLASKTEGMPGCVIEAGMGGRPVAAYAVAGVPEVVVDGVTGLLAPPGDFEALTKRVSVLLRDGRMRKTLGDAARARCRELFDIGAVASRYLRLYQDVMKS